MHVPLTRRPQTSRATSNPSQVGRSRQLRIAAVLSAAMALSACGNQSGAVLDAVITTTTAPKKTAIPEETTATTAAPATTTTVAPATSLAPSTAPSVATTTTVTTTTLAPAAAPAGAQNYSKPAPVQAEPTFPDDNSNAPATLIGKIRIPKIGVDMGLYDGVTMPILDLGPGHWPGTAWPGDVGNTVIGGHRTSHHAVFRNIDDLQPGDKILVDDARGTHTYSVTRTQVVDPSAVWIVDPTPTATITLFACHPPGSTRQRYIVFGSLDA